MAERLKVMEHYFRHSAIVPPEAITAKGDPEEAEVPVREIIHRKGFTTQDPIGVGLGRVSLDIPKRRLRRLGRIEPVEIRNHWQK